MRLANCGRWTKLALGLPMLLAASASGGEDECPSLFGNPTPVVPIGNAARLAGAADFDQDGALDLVVIQDLGKQGKLFLGMGDGSFERPSSLPLNDDFSLSGQIITADLSGDGLPDICGPAETNHKVLLNNGDGTFSDGQTLTAGNAVAGYVNDDQIIDIVIGLEAAGLNTFLGLGAGVFDTALNTATAVNLEHLAAGDLNNDGLLDIVVGEGTNPNGTLEVLISNADGTFNGQTFDAEGDIGDIAIAGVTDDANPDVIVVNLTDDTLLLFPGNGDGTLGASQVIDDGLTGNTLGIATADYDGDGDEDIAVSDVNLIRMLINDGNAAFSKTECLRPVGTDGLLTGDFDGDGAIDLFTLGVSWMIRGRGDGTLRTGCQVFDDARSIADVAADYDGDGALDLATWSNQANTISVRAGTGAGDFVVANTFALVADSVEIAGGDFDDDGVPDLAILDQGASTVTIWLGDGDHGFTPATPAAVGMEPSNLTAADFDDDGNLDIACTTPDDGVQVLLGSGDGGLGAPTSTPVGADISSIAVGRFDAGDIPDIAAANDGSSNVQILIGNGSGGFASGDGFTVSPSPVDIESADVDDDGLADLVILRALGPQAVTVALGLGDGTFAGLIDVEHNVGGAVGCELFDVRWRRQPRHRRPR